jgi:hypothetical protein
VMRDDINDVSGANRVHHVRYQHHRLAAAISSSKLPCICDSHVTQARDRVEGAHLQETPLYLHLLLHPVVETEEQIVHLGRLAEHAAALI